MEQLLITQPDPTAAVEESVAVLSLAQGLVITGDKELDRANDILRQIKTAIAAIDGTFADSIKAAHRAHRSMIGARDRHLRPLKSAEATIKLAMGRYSREQAQLRAEAEARARDVARKAEEEKRLIEAERLEREGKPEAAEALIQSPIVSPAPIATTETKLKGTSFAERWTFKVIDDAAIPREFLKVDTAKLGRLARALRGEARVNGVEFYSEQTVRTTGL